ncbi:hypothetical protein VTN77DRAFT_1807 [Rasamsonia byssochlamydoides]|uniref:uncharacterized protein n=1 Tax=Rasamsonia byssochlamydoides TaxID=89139 RepID=UPI003743F37F
MLRCKDVGIRSAGARAGSYLTRGTSNIMVRPGYASGGLLKAASTYGQIQRGRLETPPRCDAVRRFSAYASPLQEQTSSPFTLRDLLTDNERKLKDLEAENERKEESSAKPEEKEAELLQEIASGKNAACDVSSKAVDREIQWLKDPKELADRVARLLKGGDPAKAAALVRRAQKEGIECMVAWNHLMKHCMDRGAPLAAWKFYNDMKKRGRRPNALTYTIMLDGFASEKFNQIGVKPVKLAYSIFKSIFNEKSGVKPNIFHFNTMLKVCATHHDMDTLWKVIADLPEEGPDAPDAKTYTIILSAIDATTQRDVDRIPASRVDQMIARRAVGVRDGKRIWKDIVHQWRTGRMAIDNRLVSTMAQLLVNGLDEHGCYDALALFNQTMGIPILAKKPPDAPAVSLSEESMYEATTRTLMFRAAKAREKQDALDQDAVPLDTEMVRGDQTELEEEEMAQVDEAKPEEEEEDETEETFEGLFDPVTNTTPDEKSHSDNRGSTPTLLRPGNPELSLILEACRLLTQGAGAGKDYWELLTLKDDGYKIRPDSHSFHQYLRLLRVARSSRVSLGMIRNQMVPGDAVEGKTFHIAISCCRRDRSNPNVFNNANELLALMDTQLPLPDPRALIGYIELVDVLLENPQWLMMLNGLDIGEEKRSSLALKGRKLKLALQIAAISKLQPHVSKLHDAMEHGPIIKSAHRVRLIGNKNIGSVTGFLALKALVRTRAMMDSVLGPQYESLLSKSDREWIEPEAKKLRKFSHPEMVVKFENTAVSPTREQRIQFLESREKSLMEHKRKERTEEPQKGTKQTGAEPGKERVDLAEKQVKGKEHLEAEKPHESDEQIVQQ